jgi:site-specific DNA-methyltransferase (adenine-specific)
MDYSLHLGDCLEVLKTLEDASIDAIITDPPYGTTDLSWDTRASVTWLHEAYRILKPNGYLVTFGDIELLHTVTVANFRKRWTGVWVKVSPIIKTHSAKMPMMQSEFYGVFVKNTAHIKDLTFNEIYIPGESYRKVQRLRGYVRGGKDQLDRSDSSSWTADGYVSENNGTRKLSSMIIAPNKTCMKHAERTKHPTQKPLEAMEPFVMWVTNPNDTILDPFMGSGTTGVASIQEGRKFIGIERDPEYFRMAQERIQNAVLSL